MKDISLHLMDVAQNSLSAKATKVLIQIKANQSIDCLEIIVVDNGVGMNTELLNKVTDPFVTTRTGRDIGLGIPLFKQLALMAGGDFVIRSVKNQGTVLKASFNISHIDRPPLGNVGETMSALVMARPDIEWILEFSNREKGFKFDLLEIKDKLGHVPINRHDVITWIKEYIEDGVKLIFGGVLHEIDS